MVGLISKSAISRREYWIKEIGSTTGNFGQDFDRVHTLLTAEFDKDGLSALVDHVRLSGVIPESYGHDSSEEKLYSKYTDALLARVFKALGLQSVVLQERADSADVEAVVEDYSLVADAKAFRLSRTAKNQKDFKVQEMDNWKRGKDFAIVVCPLYQLPNRSSQIYQQAISRNVCVFSYSHLSVLLNFSKNAKLEIVTHLLHEILRSFRELNPSKDAGQYWAAINRTMLGYDKLIAGLWDEEKRATLEALAASKREALQFLSMERTRLMRLSREEAIRQLIDVHKFESKIRTIEQVSENNLMEFTS